MSRVLLSALMVALASARVFAASQRIEASAGMNFIAVDLKVGENRLDDLFPSAPVGTLVFMWDAHAGWNAAQMYPFGWSHPNRQLLPREGAVLWLPSGAVLDTTLTGEEVPLPPPNQWVIYESSTRNAEVYAGWNLVSASLIDPRRTSLVIWFNKNTMSYLAYQHDELDGWTPGILPTEGAVWIRPTGAPVHPEGTFTNENTALYFNNYAPAFGINSPFYTAGCEHRAGLEVQLLEVAAGGGATAIGERVRTSAEFPGYIDPKGDLIRYVPGGRDYKVRYSSTPGGSWGESAPFRVQTADGAGTPPIPPTGLFIGPTVPIYYEQSEDRLFRPGDEVELSAIFYMAGVLSPPQVTLDVPYQWQKLNSAGEWVDVSGATTNTLRIENAQVSDAGRYRLSATYHCEEIYSRVAAVTVDGPIIASALEVGGAIHFEVEFPVSVSAVVQSSVNLKDWEDEIVIANGSNGIWSTNLNASGTIKFYRVMETP